jgi:small GTP-binding protein
MNIKGILVGATSTGKTNIIERLVHNRFDPARVATEKYDISNTWIEIESKNVIFNVTLWDTAGQERDKSIIGQFYRDCALCLVVYDVCNYSTLSEAEWWFNECVKKQPPCITDFIRPNIVLVGNQSDLEHLREVTYQEGLDLSRKLNIPYFIEQNSVFRHQANDLDMILCILCTNVFETITATAPAEVKTELRQEVRKRAKQRQEYAKDLFVIDGDTNHVYRRSNKNDECC